MLGWSPEGEEEIFSKEEFIKIFDEKRLSKSPAMFDRQNFFGLTIGMKTKDTETVFELALPHLIKANLIPENPSEKDREWGRKLIAL